MNEKARLVVTTVKSWELIDKETGELRKGNVLNVLIYVQGASFPIPAKLSAKDGLEGARVGDRYIFDLGVAQGTERSVREGGSGGRPVLTMGNFALEDKKVA